MTERHTGRGKIITISGRKKEEPSSVTQISVYDGLVADLSIDGDFTTKSSTLAEFGSALWYKMYFEHKHMFSEIVIMQSDLHPPHGRRMNDTKVSVIDTGTGSENLCGILETKEDWTIEGQTYRIPCHLKSGNQVKLTVLHKRAIHGVQAAIHMLEIMAYSQGLCFRS